MDKRGNKVEDYKLTPEHRKFQKSFSELATIRDRLVKRSFLLNYAQLSTQQMLREIATGMQSLKIPKEGVRELSGMNFSVEEEDMVNGDRNNLDLFNI